LNITGKPFILGFNALISSLFSDFLSHAPSVAVTGPIFLKLAVLSKINVLYMGLINAMAASFGFMTIIASPVNALIYTSGHIKPVDYLKTGVITTIVAVTIIVIFSILYWGLLGYHL
jgi:sodium-dependent dicarboxylate transporter 2/3/5